ncbi:MAG: hypothetical protein LBH26_03755, partial [Treponema sp.]|nr:hypothetical protein [Treponema sp.]
LINQFFYYFCLPVSPEPFNFFWHPVLRILINNLALKLHREPVSGLLGIKPFATNKKPYSLLQFTL